MVDEAGQRVGAGGLAAEAGMEADRHHPVQAVALPAQEVDVGLGVLEEVLGAGVALGEDVAGVVHDQPVGHHQVGPAVDPGPVGQVVVVAVGVVEEAALLRDQLSGVDAHLAAVPAERPAARRPGDRGDCPAHRLALLVPSHLVGVGPAEAVTGDLVAALGEALGDLGVSLEGGGDAEEGDRDAGPVEDPEEPPDPGAGAVLVSGFESEVTHPGEVDLQLPEPVVHAVAHREGLLGALLVVDDDLDRHPVSVRPLDRRRLRPIADQVAGWAVGRNVVNGEKLAVQLCRHLDSLVLNWLLTERVLPGSGRRPRR